ncbi:cytochrome bo3 quinol oxidase subunit 2 [Methylorubrum salsuginis]|uniref:Ubiquinol oxidase subunit 2 n=2 Tax=Methylorubrum salsuginis TaxID=414703 RepID=A0A1I4HV31_9HYPH|nr:cytochrome bo3 quinol oxidase subunit 2 [Methylorubrum salsuginis]
MTPSAMQVSRAPGSAARRLLRGVLLLPLLPLLAGCNLQVMFPSGDVALQQRNLVVASTGLMLLIIVPVIALTLLFAWRYRASNTQARHDPDWDHSTALEVVIWTAPLMIIIALGALTWISTHTLDPFRPLSRIEPGKPVPADTKPLEVQVVALDWKWLFFYPEYGVAVVNEAAAPVDRPITFRITASSVMNAFYIPALAGMIYAMPGMETKLHAVINKEGAYNGLSSHYSGTGFSHMTFKFHGLDKDGFDKWIAKAKAEGKDLSRDAYLELERPSEQVPVTYYSSVADGLFGSILGMCAIPGKMCMHEMMAIDAKGGAGKDSRENAERLQYDNRHAERGDEAPGANGPASHHAPRSDKPSDSKDHGPHGKGENSPAPNQLNN